MGIYFNYNNSAFIGQIIDLNHEGTSSVRIDDVNADNKLDIIVTNIRSNNIDIFFNLGNGKFSEQITYSTNLEPFSIAIMDIDNDNQRDIIIAHRTSVGILYTDCSLMNK